MNGSARPLSIKFALVTAAVGAGFAAPAHAGIISTVPAGFTPITFSEAVAKTYALDLDRNNVVDFTIDSIGSGFGPDITGEALDNKIHSTFFTARWFDDPADFLSANGIKGLQSVTLTDGNASATPSYAELVFTGANNVLTRGYIQGYTTGDDIVGMSFTLLDFGLAPEGEVPEPGSLALLAAGAAGIGALRRRRKARAL